MLPTFVSTSRPAPVEDSPLVKTGNPATALVICALIVATSPAFVTLMKGTPATAGFCPTMFSVVPPKLLIT